MNLAPKPTNTRMATILRRTITLLVSADSRIPRTRITVSSMTIKNAGQLKPKCQPGGESSFPGKSIKPPGRDGGENQRGPGWAPNHSRRPATWAEDPELTAQLLNAE